MGDAGQEPQHAPQPGREYEPRGSTDAQNPNRRQPVDNPIRKLEPKTVEQIGQQDREDHEELFA